MTMDFTGLSFQIHRGNIDAGWWKVVDGVTQPRNIGELLCLVHSEISEGFEGWVDDLMDDHLPDRKMVEVEMADASIRTLDIFGYYGVEVGEIEVRQGKSGFSYMHCHVARAMEGFRKGRTEDGIAALKELLVAIVTFCEFEGLDLVGAIAEKRVVNANRLDHKPENRAKPGGKQW